MLHLSSATRPAALGLIGVLFTACETPLKHTTPTDQTATAEIELSSSAVWWGNQLIFSFEARNSSGSDICFPRHVLPSMDATPSGLFYILPLDGSMAQSLEPVMIIRPDDASKSAWKEYWKADARLAPGDSIAFSYNLSRSFQFSRPGAKVSINYPFGYTDCSDGAENMFYSNIVKSSIAADQPT